MLTHPEEDSVSSTLIYSRVGHSAGRDLAHPLSPGVPTLLHVVACYACIVCRMDWGVDYKDHCLNAFTARPRRFPRCLPLWPVQGGFPGALFMYYHVALLDVTEVWVLLALFAGRANRFWGSANFVS